MPECPTGPPEIAARLEDREGSFPHLDRIMQPAAYGVDLGKTAVCEGVDVVQAEGRSNRRRLAAMLDRYIGSPTCQAVKEASPIMPSGAAARVVGLVHDAADCFQGLNVFRVSTERKLYLGLFEHGVDAAQPIRLRVRHRIEAVERIAEIGQRLVVGPTALSFFRRQYRVIDGLLSLVAPAEVECQQFRDFLGTAAIQFFERVSDRSV